MKHTATLLLPLLLGMLSCSVDPVQKPDGLDGSQVAPAPESAAPGIIMVKLDAEIADDPEAVDLSFLGDYTITRSLPEGGRFDARHREAGLHRWYNVSFAPELPLTKAAGDLSSTPGISGISYVMTTKSASTGFNDPDFGKQWDFYNPGTQSGTIAGSDINLLPAWEVTTGSSNVIVAICDSAPEYEHEDLAGNMWVNEAEANGTPGVDDDDNGYIDDIHGYNFVVEPYYGPELVPGDHGTHIAGTIGAVNNNGIGISGIAGGDSPEGNGVRMMSVQTSNNDESAYIGAAIVYAADNGAVIMNCSWSIAADTQFINEAIDYFNTYAGFDEDGNQTGPMAGGLCIFAAGNDGTTVSYPAMNDNVFAVASISADYEAAYYTNYGRWVDIAAPGGDAQKGFQIYSTVTNASGKYGEMQGTSMACPHVVGVAALVVSHYGGPGFTRQQLIDILKGSANPVIYDYNPMLSDKLGAGLVDAGAALTMDDVSTEPVDDLKAEARSNFVNLSWTARADGRGSIPYAYDIYWSTSSLEGLNPDSPAANVTSVEMTPANDTPDGTVLNYTVSGLDFNTGYFFRIRSRNIFGQASELSEQVEVSTGGNTAPEITALDGTSLNLKSHETGTLRFSLTDADGHELRYALQTAEGSPALKGIYDSISDDGVLTLTVDALAADQGANYEGVLLVSDSYTTVSQEFSYSVGVNHAPVAGTPDNVVLNSRTESLSIPLSEIISDEDGEALSYACSISTTNIIVRCSVSDGNLNLDGNAYGTTEVTVSATDARGESATCSFKVLVRDGSSEIDLYPNPVVDMLNIRTGAAVSADITISNAAGAVVFSQDGASIDPFAPVKVDMSGLPGGVYYVSVSGEGINSSSSIAKQ